MCFFLFLNEPETKPGTAALQSKAPKEINASVSTPQLPSGRRSEFLLDSSGFALNSLMGQL